MDPADIADYDINGTECQYMGTEHIEEKIYLIGVAATFIALLSIAFNTFFTIVFIKNRNIRQSAVFYFGIIAVIDTIMAINYLAVMSLPVYMDYYRYLPMYYLFLSYFRVVLTESSCAMFASMLLIVLATTERLLRTFDNQQILKCRKFVEKNRPKMCAICVLIAVAYKLCVYWEIDVTWKPQCEDPFEQYEIVPGPLTHNESYRFYWMFLTRNVVDRILPFFLLVAMNYVVIKALKKDYKRQPKASLHERANQSSKANRGSLRDATRALISMVSMYLLGQSLQVLLTFWETLDRKSLEQMDVVYSYLNDIVSIMTLLSSCLRFPVYLTCNRQIYNASRSTVEHFVYHPKVYEPIQRAEVDTTSPDERQKLRALGAVFNDKLQEWQL